MGKELWVVVHIKYGKFGSVLLEHFIEHKLWNWEECNRSQSRWNHLWVKAFPNVAAIHFLPNLSTHYLYREFTPMIQILQPCWNVHSFVPVECTHWQTEFVLDLHVPPTYNLVSSSVMFSAATVCCSPWLYHRSSISTQLKCCMSLYVINWLWLPENQ